MPFVYQALQSYAPSDRLIQIQNQVLAICTNGIRLNYEHAELHKLFTSSHIPYVVMKGPVAAAYYSQPELQVMGDVDFLVREEDLDRAGKLLESVGFRPVDDDENQAHLAYHRIYSTWEMHWEPNGIPGNQAGNLVREYLTDMIDRAELYTIEEGCFYVPCRFHHGLTLLLHTATHLINTGIGVRHLCDWAVFVESISDDEFIKLFEEKLKKTGLWRFAKLLTLLYPLQKRG